jgi:hypothetical protein
MMNKDPATLPSTPVGSVGTKRQLSPGQKEEFTGKQKTLCTRDRDFVYDEILDYTNKTYSEPTLANLAKMSSNSGIPEATNELVKKTLNSTLANFRMEWKADLMSVVTEVTNGMLERIAALEHEVMVKDRQIDELSYRMDTLDMNSRVKNVKFVGVPEVENEEDDEDPQIEDPKTTVLEIASKINAKISFSDIVYCERVGRKDKGPRPIKVTFATTNAKMELFKMRKELAKSTDKDLKNVFVNVDLSPFRSQLLYIARKLKADNLIAKYWVYKNEVNIKIREEEEKGKPIRSLYDLTPFHDHRVFQGLIKPKFVPKKTLTAIEILAANPKYAELFRDMLSNEPQAQMADI